MVREVRALGLDDYGFRVIMASSFADIFLTTALKWPLPIVLKEEIIESLFREVEALLVFLES